MTYNKYIHFANDWDQFKISCEKKTKDRCFLNSNCWRRLKQWHLEQYCGRIDQPFGFLFEFKYMHKRAFISTPGSNTLYYKYLRARQDIENGINQK